MAELAAYLKIDASQLVLMLQIFSELHFVTIENGQLTPIAQPANQKIETAPSYQSRQTQIETEKQLLYSESAVLKQLLTSFTADK